MKLPKQHPNVLSKAREFYVGEYKNNMPMIYYIIEEQPINEVYEKGGTKSSSRDFPDGGPAGPSQRPSPPPSFKLNDATANSPKTRPAKDSPRNSKESNKVVSVTHNRIKRITNDFERKIGSGGYGNVYFGKWNGQEVAVKCLKMKIHKRQSSAALAKKQFFSEIYSLMNLSFHPNVCKLLGYSLDGPELCLVYKYVKGIMLDACLSKKSKKVLNIKERLSIMLGLAKAILYIQTAAAHPYVHRDVKSSNVVLESDEVTVLLDFGLAIPLIGEKEQSDGIEFSHSTTVGTGCYMAPEAFKGMYSLKTDIYSLGVVLYELITGLPPYSYSRKTDLASYIRRMESKGEDTDVMLDPRCHWSACRRLTQELFDLARQCTSTDCRRRPSIQEVVGRLQALEGEHF